jgi:hypothetical protein
VVKDVGLILICISALASFGQTSPAKYQPGTITAVIAHQKTPQEAGEEATRYDVSIKIRNVVYVVLYTPPAGDNSVEYYSGLQMLFLVGPTTLTVNSKTSGAVEMPIVSREVLPAQSGIDWSKAPSQYFSMKQHHLSEALGLTDDQQAKIKRFIEQEASEAGMILWTPVVPVEQRLKQYKKIVKASDSKIKPFLSSAQVAKLVELRKQQEVELKELIAQPMNGKDN